MKKYVSVVSANFDPVPHDPVDPVLWLRLWEARSESRGGTATAFDAFLSLMHLTRDEITVFSNLLDASWLRSSSSILVPIPFLCQLGVCLDALSQVFHTVWTQISNTVSSMIVIEVLPSRIVILIGFVYIHVDRLNLDR